MQGCGAVPASLVVDTKLGLTWEFLRSLSLVASAQGGEPGTPVCFKALQTCWAAGWKSGSCLCRLIVTSVKIKKAFGRCSDLCLARTRAQPRLGQTQALGYETFPGSLAP